MNSVVKRTKFIYGYPSDSVNKGLYKRSATFYKWYNIYIDNEFDKI